MENPKVVLTFHTDTYELDIDAPELSLDFVLSIIERAKRMLDHQERIVVAQQMGAVAAQARDNEARTKRVISNLKM